MHYKGLLNTQELLTLVTDSQTVQESVVEYDEPLVKFVNQTLNYALEVRASDIHIEPFEKCCRIRLRLDGLLKTISEIPMVLCHRLITRLKVLAKLNIAEKRLPQDGRFPFMINEKKIDIRLSVCPTIYGEKMVLRLLNTDFMLLEMDKLGLSASQLALFQKKISQPQGLILVVGPTGSGKTVTLYSALHYLNSENKNISTVEDPVEIELPGINQVAVQSKMGLTFETVLRAFLRQDPDIIMVGEIRDSETARIALQAAQTGHLVLTTLHANTSYEAFVRLQTLGLSLEDCVNATTLIVSQRLVRKISGGRTGIFELVSVDIALSDMLHENFSRTAWRQWMQKHQFPSLLESGQRCIAEGMFNESELQRVLTS